VTTKCPIGRRLIDPCPGKVFTGEHNACLPCIEGWRERTAILEYGQGTGGSSERPTCANREQAEALATKQLREAVAKAEHEQGMTS
jgi:hypothetical protein